MFLLLLLVVSTSVEAQTFTSYSPNTVTRQTRVTINGTGFTNGTSVVIAGVTATKISTTPTQIIAAIPATGGNPASGNVTVAGISLPGLIYVTPTNTTGATAKITKVYTDYNGYWVGQSPMPSVMPDFNHNMLGFEYGGTTYATGVKNSTLTNNSVTFTNGDFRAFPFLIVGGTAGGSAYLAMGAKVDGNPAAANYQAPNVAGTLVRDVLIDGKKGLNLGTGVTNLTTTTLLSIDIAGVTLSSIGDNTPDVVITQTADPSGSSDIYCFTDAAGNIVGNPMAVSLNSGTIPSLGTHRYDLFTLANGSNYATVTPSGNGSTNTTRNIRMIAYKLSEFGITAANYNNIAKFHIYPSSTSDPAFIAYNKGSFILLAPEITVQPQSQVACVGTGASVTFTVTATGDNLTYQWKKNGVNIPGATGSSYTKNNVIAADVAAYSVLVTNPYGAVLSDPAYLNTVITIQPTAQATCINNQVSLEVIADGANVTYQWYSNESDNNSTGTLIPGATNNTYSPPVDTAGTLYYYAILSNSGQSCAGAVTNAVAVEVSNPGVAGVASGNQTICSGTTAQMSVNGSSGRIRWQISANGTSGWSNVSSGSGESTPTYTTGPVTETTYYRARLGESSCGYVYTNTVIITVSDNMWTGAVSTDWNTPNNWSCGSVPSLIVNARIPVVVSNNYPVINNVSGVASVKNITIDSGASVTVSGNGAGTLEIAGTITNNGTFSASNGTIAMRGTSAQTIPANAFSGNTLRNLTINNTSGVTLGGATNLTGIIRATAGTFNTAGFLTMKSNASTTAMVAPIATNANITGNVTVERYIPARRAFRLVSSPVNGGSIFNNWQEGAPVGDIPGFGTDITGTGGATNGFDVSGSNNPSLFTFDNIANQWNAVETTTATNLTAGTPYRILVRGDRTIDQTSNSAAPTSTTLRSRGTLVKGNVTVSTLSNIAGRQNYVGNPYQAPVDMKTVVAEATNINPNFYYAWDPTLGGTPVVGQSGGRGAYVTVTLTGSGGTNNTSSAVGRYLMPFQACFVQTAANGPASLTFKESHKTLLTNTTYDVYRTESEPAAINVLLYDTNSLALNATAADGFVVQFDSEYSNEVDAFDAAKFTNQDENVAITKGESNLSIERRAMPQATDVIHMFNSQYRKSQYTYKVNVSGLEGVTAYLVDTFTNTTTPLANNEDTLYNFSVGTDLEGSTAADRFQIIFEQVVLGNDDFNTLANVSVYPNPATSGQFYINLPQGTDKADVKVYNTLGQQIQVNVATGSNNTLTVKPVSPMADGIYMVEIASEGSRTTKKLIIK